MDEPIWVAQRRAEIQVTLSAVPRNHFNEISMQLLRDDGYERGSVFVIPYEIEDDKVIVTHRPCWSDSDSEYMFPGHLENAVENALLNIYGFQGEGNSVVYSAAMIQNELKGLKLNLKQIEESISLLSGSIITVESQKYGTYSSASISEITHCYGEFYKARFSWFHCQP